jgi:hypothetical protein
VTAPYGVALLGYGAGMALSTMGEVPAGLACLMAGILVAIALLGNRPKS